MARSIPEAQGTLTFTLEPLEGIQGLYAKKGRRQPAVLRTHQGRVVNTGRSEMYMPQPFCASGT